METKMESRREINIRSVILRYNIINKIQLIKLFVSYFNT